MSPDRSLSYTMKQNLSMSVTQKQQNVQTACTNSLRHVPPQKVGRRAVVTWKQVTVCHERKEGSSTGRRDQNALLAETTTIACFKKSHFSIDSLRNRYQSKTDERCRVRNFLETSSRGFFVWPSVFSLRPFCNILPSPERGWFSERWFPPGRACQGGYMLR